MITPPTASKYEALQAAQAHRHPVKAAIRLIGDGGAEVRVPLVIGLPSGACIAQDGKLPDGARPDAAWNDTLGVTFLGGADTPAKVQRLAADCVLWPPRAEFSRLCARWPALPAALLPSLRAHTGSELAAIVDSTAAEEPPPAIADALRATPAAIWYHLRPRGAGYSVAIIPPARARWTLFQEAIRARDVDLWPQLRDMAIASVIACVDEDTNAAEPLASILTRYPGLAVLILAATGRLAGVAAEVELGEW